MASLFYSIMYKTEKLVTLWLAEGRPPKHIHILMPRICEYVALHGKGMLRLPMELRWLPVDNEVGKQ